MSLKQRLALMVVSLLVVSLCLTWAALTWIAHRSLLEQLQRDGVLLARQIARVIEYTERVPDDVEEAIGQQMIVEARLTAHVVAVAERAGLKPAEITAILRDITEHTVLNEIWVSDEKGHAYLRNKTDIDFTFHPDPRVQPQASAFWQLLTREKEVVVQAAQKREVDDKWFKYAGVAGLDKPRIVEVGYQADYL